MMNRNVVSGVLLSLLLVACAASEPSPQGEAEQPATEVTLMLDWVPNVNHTGIFVAQQKGYFEETGLSVEIVQPGEVYAEQAVASNAVEFGISFQEIVTLSRADDVPLVSIAAIIQHNTSGFASLADKGVASPADWEGLTYGSFGSPFEEPTLRQLMECAGGDFSQLQIVDTGFADPLALISEGQIDLAWVFYGTQGIAADQQGIDLNAVMMADHLDCIPDYYTPVFITSEEMIAGQPEVVSAFLTAVARGYDYAIQNPDEAAAILLEQTPESGLDLLKASQSWLSPRYQADAPRWGEQQRSVWEDYARWMVDHRILAEPIDVDAAFTNQFLP